ncbi:MAG: hypothetical protein PHV55_08515 [Candidatus Omnitrophica bacterium]|nr:hypothetical protein [Candidatus Omnitrophota bacterium]
MRQKNKKNARRPSEVIELPFSNQGGEKMRLEDLEGKLVLFKLSEEIKSDLPLFQVYSENLWAVVTGVENEGVWIENPAYELGIWWDEKGNLIPPQKQVKEQVRANVLLFWRYIKGIMSVEDDRFQRIKNKDLPGFQVYR